MSSPHDRYLAAYRRRDEEMWCVNRECANHENSIDVTYEEEYGQGWTTPEDCPLCHSDLTFDKPDEEEEGGTPSDDQEP